jgi:hypothetical protein
MTGDGQDGRGGGEGEGGVGVGTWGAVRDLGKHNSLWGSLPQWAAMQLTSAAQMSPLMFAPF